MAAGGARVGGVDAAVGEAVERHGRAAGEDHAQQDADELHPLKAGALPGQHGAGQGERQREDGVAEANQLQKRADMAEHRAAAPEEGSSLAVVIATAAAGVL